jgi:tetratricopeptide (TPR) repeat protein
VRRERTVPSGVERYRAFDAVVSWARLNDEALQRSTWDFVLGHATDPDRLTVGITAYQAEEGIIARTAFAGVAKSGDSTYAPVGVFNLGIVLQEQGDPQGARAAFQQAIDSHHPDRAPMAMVSLGALLKEQGDLQGARAALQMAIDSHHPDVASIAAVNLGLLLLHRHGDEQGARVAYQQIIDSYSPEQAPEAAISLGELLQEQGDLQGAGGIPAGDRLPPSRRRAQGCGAPWEPARTVGRTNAAKAAYQLAIDSGHPDANAAAAARLRTLT